MKNAVNINQHAPLAVSPDEAARRMAKALVQAAEEVERGEPADVLPEFGMNLN